MMTKKMTPHRWAFKITNILNTVYSESERFPVNIKTIAQDISQQIFPDDPLTKIKGGDLPTFDGGLFKAPSNKKGWGIIYNNSITSQGRINFTLAHEFGHYLLHRIEHPDGINCNSQNITRWNSEYGQIEHQANVFAANLLMPLDDYRQHIDAKKKVDFDLIGQCAERYQVSLIAATLRWIEYTENRAAIVVSRDGFVLWCRASKAAFKNGIFYRTATQTIPIPDNSLASVSITTDNNKQSVKLPAEVWFNEPCEEMIIFSDNYDFVISLLQFER